MDRINTHAELVRFIELNFDNITEFDYCELLREALDVYAIKPTTKEQAIKDLNTYFEKYAHLIEKPIFLHLWK